MSLVRRFCAWLLGAWLLVGCQMGPDYVQPPMDLGASYQQVTEVAGWTQIGSADWPREGSWWQMYQDHALNDLMQRLNQNNPSIAQAHAQYRQALALLKATGAGLYPTIGLNAELTRADVPFTGPGGNVLGSFGPNTQHSVSLGLSWELDVWGAIAREIERAQAQAQVSAAELAAATLSAQVALASSYFQLRGLDRQIGLLEQTVATYTKSLALTGNLMRAGLSDASEVAVARAQLEGARSQLVEAQRQRAVLEHALATLVGEPPSRLSVQAQHLWKTDVVVVPAGVPSMLLLRRPDVAAAERRVAAANAGIGVATAAWFPTLSISANAGYQSSQFSQWFSAPAQFWALGPMLAGTLFDAGRRTARIEQAQAEFDSQAASYRATTLKALQEVEDALVQLRLLQTQIGIQGQAVQAARESVRIKRNQYEKGLTDFLSVAVLETTALNAQRSELALQTERLTASVKLIAALGGGWSTDDLPNPSNAVRTSAAGSLKTP